jgi:hypothetical protein
MIFRREVCRCRLVDRKMTRWCEGEKGTRVWQVNVKISAYTAQNCHGLMNHYTDAEAVYFLSKLVGFLVTEVVRYMRKVLYRIHSV